ncbi:Alpha-mannosidase [Sarcoptes scabiei]|nr:Alpha-mannosidase [Sarcoptes scabiei]
MPTENLEEESLAKNPNLEYAQWLFQLTITENPLIQKQLLDAIIQNDMAPFYKEVCETLKWPFDQELFDKMTKKNEDRIKELEFAIEDAEQNLGEMEVREANLAKAEYYSSIGDKENSLQAFRKTYEKTVSLGHRLDLLFHLIRIGLFYLDHKLIATNIEKAKTLIEEGGDWDRRNRLRVYQGFYCITIRDFNQAASLFLDTISTFTCYELCSYETFVAYTVITSMISLPRVELRERVIKGAEILEVLHENKELREYLFSLYECEYSRFFVQLCWIENYMKQDRLFQPHYRYYIREMRILAYNQLLESYQSLELKYMAKAFGVSVQFIDQDLARFIAAGRLYCKIDNVNDIVETNRPDSKNHQYQACIKHGDILLNRIQKLSRIINI